MLKAHAKCYQAAFYSVSLQKFPDDQRQSALAH